MNSRKHIFLFIIAFLLVTSVSLLNLSSYYHRTKNTNATMIEHLKGKDEFDSFIVDLSGSAAFPIEELNGYTGGNFYNTFYNGVDILDSVDIVKYLVDNYEVKNIILPVGFSFASSHDVESHPLNNTSHYKDVEPISDIETYLAKENHSSFQAGSPSRQDLNNIANFMSSVEEIIYICEDNKVNLIVLVSPLYHDNFQYYDIGQVEEFYTILADIVPYWDFCKSGVSYEPRYFYDRGHWRKDVGTMMLAKIFGNEGLYVPEDFGIYVNGDPNQAIGTYKKDIEVNTDGYTKDLPVLMYHHIDDEGDGQSIISERAFISQMEEIKESGYNTVTMTDLIDYVDYGMELPDKPLLITFDDGYTSNYEIAYPIMKELGLNGVIFPIGHSVGMDEYKDTGEKIYPHFSIKEAKEMGDVFDFGSHTFDMHQSEPLESGDKVRKNVKMLEGEREEEYINDFIDDFNKEDEIIKQINGEGTYAFAYPNGVYEDLAALLLSQEGVRVTFLTKGDDNVLIKGLKTISLRTFKIQYERLEGIIPL